MTSNQIEYQKLLETRRSNMAQEFLTSRRDTATIQNKELELSEGKRHNLATEAMTLEDLGIKRMTAEANVSNAESNARNAATNEFNALTNARNADSNYLQALAAQASSGAAYQSALAAQTSAQAAYINAEEQVRHHGEEEAVAAYEAQIKQRQSKSEIGKRTAETHYLEAQTLTEARKREYITAQTETEAARKAQLEAQTATEAARASQLQSQAEFTSLQKKWYPVDEVVQNLERGSRIYSTISSTINNNREARRKNKTGSGISGAVKKLTNTVGKGYWKTVIG